MEKEIRRLKKSVLWKDSVRLYVHCQNHALYYHVANCVWGVDHLIQPFFWKFVIEKNFGSTIEVPVLEEKKYLQQLMGIFLKQKLNNFENLFEMVQKQLYCYNLKSKYFRCNCLKINKQPHQGCL